MDFKPDYSKWSTAELIDRVTKLEEELRESALSYGKHARVHVDNHSSVTSQPAERFASKPKKPKKDFDSSRYTTRFIAIKFAYLGGRYNGYEYSKNATRLPTIEEELWKALIKTKLIFPTGPEEVNWKGCDYSKCGRTDKGVSAFGQVIGIRVRSNRRRSEPSDGESNELEVVPEEPAFDPINDELAYPRLLNRVLPDDIRVLAWCPSPPPDFSARFSCRERRYRYFFTQPAYMPRADALGLRHWRNGKMRKDGWLDIAAMQEAAGYFVGTHDFRNFCKHDPARQTTNFERHITYCAIEEATSSSGMPAFVDSREYGMAPAEEAKVYTFTVYGSAFLWHQVRHMAAILFHVGQGLERPSIAKDLLDVEENPSKPMYEMADDAPLVLWDCIFPDEEPGSPRQYSGVKSDALHWIPVDGQSPDDNTAKDLSALASNGRFGPGGLQEVVWAGWRKKKINELLAAALLDRVAYQQVDLKSSTLASVKTSDGSAEEALPFGAISTKSFDGGNGPRMRGLYIPIMERDRIEHFEILNARYAERKVMTAKGVADRASPDGDE